MPATKPWSSADFNVVIARVTPDILVLLSDRVARSRARSSRRSPTGIPRTTSSAR
jgi:hypothetical protein